MTSLVVGRWLSRAWTVAKSYYGTLIGNPTPGIQWYNFRPPGVTHNRGMGPTWGAFCQITLTSCLSHVSTLGHWRAILIQQFSQSVRLSVTFWYCIERLNIVYSHSIATIAVETAIPKLSNGTIFNHFEWPLTQISRSWSYYRCRRHIVCPADARSVCGGEAKCVV